jgi:glycosyltransferase involved in cell wall biosynthesis
VIIGMLSTFPPTQCGLATFASALTRALGAIPGSTVQVVRALDATEAEKNPAVQAHLVRGDRLSQRRSVDALNRTDVVVVQHEYGIYGGRDGNEVLGVLRQVSVPQVAVLHTVLSRPSPSQRDTLNAVCALADAVVVMSQAARERLLRRYEVPPGKVVVIPHGVAPAFSHGPGSAVPGRVLTWGLIGPGKGIEWGIDAMAGLVDVPSAHYLVAGQTHPKVLEAAGESYRDGLVRRAESLGIADRVVFDATYRPTAELPTLARSASVVLLPYESDEQVTSGVLIEAVAAGRPVVASAFPHAVELLASGAGITVPSRDPAAMRAALREVLTRPELAASMSRAARAQAARFHWPVVAQRYVAVAERIAPAAGSAGHLTVAGA